MRRRFSRLPVWLRRFLLWHTRRAYGTWTFPWMNGEVGYFVFRSAGNPTFAGVIPAVAIYAGLIATAFYLGEMNFAFAFLHLLASLFFISPVLSAAMTMLILDRWRRTEAMEELAVLPFARDAMRTILLLPTAMVIRAGNQVLAWMLFLMVPIWLGADAAKGFSMLFGVANSSQLAFNFSYYSPIFLIFTGPIAFYCYAISCSGISAGWFLATRFHGANALALTMCWGMRMLLGVFGSLVGCAVFVYYAHGDLGGLDLGLAALALIFFWRQAWIAGVTIPNGWARRDTVLMQRHGVEILRTPESFQAVAGRPRLGRTLQYIIWPWPTLGTDDLFVDADEEHE